MNIDFSMLSESMFSVNYISQKEFNSKNFLNKEAFLNVYLLCFSPDKLLLITRNIKFLFSIGSK